MDKLAEFLVKAKVATYANEQAAGKKKLEDGATELRYQEGNLLYRDRYYGSHTFIGEEVVFEGTEKIWGMNYYGTLLDDEAPIDEFTEFLKKAMRQVSEDRPFRGPDSYEEGEFIYEDKSEGNIEQFRGTETITLSGKEIYRLHYHGGAIRDF